MGTDLPEYKPLLQTIPIFPGSDNTQDDPINIRLSDLITSGDPEADRQLWVEYGIALPQIDPFTREEAVQIVLEDVRSDRCEPKTYIRQIGDYFRVEPTQRLCLDALMAEMSLSDSVWLSTLSQTTNMLPAERSYVDYCFLAEMFYIYHSMLKLDGSIKMAPEFESLINRNVPLFAGSIVIEDLLTHADVGDIEKYDLLNRSLARLDGAEFEDGVRTRMRELLDAALIKTFTGVSAGNLSKHFLYSGSYEYRNGINVCSEEMITWIKHLSSAVDRLSNGDYLRRRALMDIVADKVVMDGKALYLFDNVALSKMDNPLAKDYMYRYRILLLLESIGFNHVERREIYSDIPGFVINRIGLNVPGVDVAVLSELITEFK